MQSPYSGTAVYRNARIVDPSRGVDEIGTLFVVDGKIAAAGAQTIAEHNQGPVRFFRTPALAVIRACNFWTRNVGVC